MARTRSSEQPADLAEAARMLRAVVDAVPAASRAEKAIAREARAVAVAFDTVGQRLDWSTSETRS